MSGLVLFPCLASLYAAAAIIQWEFRVVQEWEPGVRQGAALTWVGAWTLVVLAGSVRLFASGGIAAVGAIGGGAFLWCLFVGLPLLLTFFRNAAPRDEHRGGFIDD